MTSDQLKLIDIIFEWIESDNCIIVDKNTGQILKDAQLTIREDGKLLSEYIKERMK